MSSTFKVPLSERGGEYLKIFHVILRVVLLFDVLVN